jgi:hypothetical protein
MVAIQPSGNRRRLDGNNAVHQYLYYVAIQVLYRVSDAVTSAVMARGVVPDVLGTCGATAAPSKGRYGDDYEQSSYNQAFHGVTPRCLGLDYRANYRCFLAFSKHQSVL